MLESLPLAYRVTMHRLHWGCGPVVVPGWENSDVEDYGQEHVGDLLDRLPWFEHTFDYVVTNHALQMVGYHEMVRALSELRRVLKPGGWLRILVPDFHLALRAYLHDEPEHFLIADDVEPTLEGKVLAYLTWYSTARTLFTRGRLVGWCERAGFARAEPVGFGETLSEWEAIVSLDSREHESAIVEAQR